MSHSLHFNGHFSRWTWVSRYQNVSILDFTGAKDDGGGGEPQIQLRTLKTEGYTRTMTMLKVRNKQDPRDPDFGEPHIMPRWYDRGTKFCVVIKWGGYWLSSYGSTIPMTLRSVTPEGATKYLGPHRYAQTV